MTIAELVVKVGADISVAQKALGQIKQDVDGTGAAAEKNAARWSAAMDRMGHAASAAGLGVLGALGLATKGAAEFEQSMRQVDSMAKLSETGFQKLTQAVMGIAKDPRITQTPQDLAKALYDVVGSGFEGQKALDVLRQAAIGASAGMTDTHTSAKALVGVLNSGIPGIHSSREAMDVLFQTADRGQITFEQLASEIGQILPTAAQAGVSLQEVGAFLAVATKQSQSAGAATNDLMNLLVKIRQPGEQAEKEFHKLGISYGLNALQAKGLAGVLAELELKTRGHREALSRLFPDLQANRAALTAITQGGRLYREELGQMTTASQGLGATEEARMRIAKAALNQWALLKKELAILGVEVGKTLLPFLRDATRLLREWLQGFNNLTPAAQEFAVKCTAIGAATLVLGSRILALTRLVLDLKKAFGLAGVAGAAMGGAGTAAGGAGTAGVAGAAGLLARAGPLVTLGGTLVAGAAGRHVGDWVGDRVRGAMGLSADGKTIPSWWPSWMPTAPGAHRAGAGGRSAAGGGGLDSLTVKGGANIAGLTEEAKNTLAHLDAVLSQHGARGIITSGRDGHKGVTSAHNSGQAIDMVLPGQNMADVAATLRGLGFRAGFERKGQRNANGSVSSGAHIHVTLGAGHIAGAKDAPGGVHPYAAGGAPMFGGDLADRPHKKSAAEREAERFRQAMGATNASIRDLRAGGDTKGGLESLRAQFPGISPARVQQLYNARQTRDGLTDRKREAEQQQRRQIELTGRLKEELGQAKIHFEQASGTSTKFDEALRRLGISTRELTPRMREMGKQISDWDAKTLKLEQHKEQMRRMAGDMAGIFTGALFHPVERGFKGLFASIRQGFTQMLVQMAEEYVKSQLFKLLSHVLLGGKKGGGGAGGLLGAVIGGVFGGKRALGGSVRAGSSYLVGEEGPELVTMGGNGSVTPNRRLAGAGGGVTINMHISTPDAGSFRRSETQIYQDAMRQARRHTARQGA